MTPSKPLPLIAIPGGAGTNSRNHISAEQDAAYHAALQSILLAAQQLLADGGSALDAVSLAVDMLEDESGFLGGIAKGRQGLRARMTGGRRLAAARQHEAGQAPGHAYQDAGTDEQEPPKERDRHHGAIDLRSLKPKTGWHAFRFTGV